jgi:AAA15 family ATPase/GTPase
MRITALQLQNFKRFTDLQIQNIPAEAKLVLLIGANGSGKSSVFDAFEWFKINKTPNKAPINGEIEGYYKKRSDKDIVKVKRATLNWQR